MLKPDQRSLYSDALRPPPGWRLDRAVASTYSLDLTALMAFPLHLAVLDAADEFEGLLADGIALLEAMRRITSKLTVFCQGGRIHAPVVPRSLYAMLEPVLHEVRIPESSGCLHAKFWLLRFVFDDATSADDVRLRLVVPTRNITYDRCWDLVLSLDGTPRGRRTAANRDLRELIDALPGLCVNSVDSLPREALADLADELHRTEWELPDGFDELWFHALHGSSEFPIPESNRLAVIAPFVTDGALAELASWTDHADALISRPEELARLRPETLELFERCLVLHENTEPDDIEEPLPWDTVRQGLHAKAYIAESGGDTHVFVGSANATSAAYRHNIEILAQLTGRKRRVGGIDDLIGPDSMGALLVDFDLPEERVAPDAEALAAEAAMNSARDALAGARLRVACQPRDDGSWGVELIPAAAVPLTDVDEAWCWPVSLNEEQSRADATPLRDGDAIVLGAADIANVTGLIAFELRVRSADVASRFVLNLSVDGIDRAERDAAILRGVIRNREAFLRYLLLLLGDDAERLLGRLSASGRGQWTSGFTGLALLEELAKALYRSPERLKAVRTVVEQLRRGADRDDVVPPEFMELWATFEQVLQEEEEA
jgi:hypothetical protein